MHQSDGAARVLRASFEAEAVTLPVPARPEGLCGICQRRTDLVARICARSACPARQHTQAQPITYRVTLTRVAGERFLYIPVEVRRG